MSREKHIRGGDALDRKLAEIGDPKMVRKVIRAANNYAMTPVLQAARANIPRGTRAHRTYLGRLVSPGFASRSVRRVTRVVGNSILTRVGVRKEAFYALFFEEGTQNTPQRPWLKPAYENNEARLFDRWSDKVLAWYKKVASQR